MRQALVQAAHGAIRTKGSFFAGFYQRLAARRGRKRALLAVARKLLVVLYHVLLWHEPYQERGEDYLDERTRTSMIDRMVHRLEKLGCRVVIEQTAVAA